MKVNGALFVGGSCGRIPKYELPNAAALIVQQMTQQ